MAIKVCPVVIRAHKGQRSILAFHHPTAGTQIVKGTPNPTEPLATAALRELREESGITATDASTLGTALIGTPADEWHFFICKTPVLPDAWDHQTIDDDGHVFGFFWHPLDVVPDASWHPMFHSAYQHIIHMLRRA
jgi:8-oxo-dGTP pyrophosphatase MutT (NUDIX family)